MLASKAFAPKDNRYEFIAKVVARDEIKDWIAIDDDAMGGLSGSGIGWSRATATWPWAS